jgi:predicted nucleic acid-binding protein
MRVLVDTSVWVEHFRHSDPQLVALLHADAALGHPLVVAELACGTPPAPRVQTLANLAQLQTAHQASLPEVLGFIERHQLHGQGCGVVDMMLLASTCITPGARLWTHDRRLAALAQRLGVDHASAMH